MKREDKIKSTINDLDKYCNPLDILSSTAGILLFNLVFYDGVTSVSVSTLKPPLRVIGVLLLKL